MIKNVIIKEIIIHWNLIKEVVERKDLTHLIDCTVETNEVQRKHKNKMDYKFKNKNNDRKSNN